MHRKRALSSDHPGRQRGSVAVCAVALDASFRLIDHRAWTFVGWQERFAECRVPPILRLQ
jgi:hypothetical protein